MSYGDAGYYDGYSSGYSSDSSTESVQPATVTLAKIFMVTLNPKSLEEPKEWDGTDPGPTKALFVHVCIDNTTYTSYVSVGTAKKRQRQENTFMGRHYVPDYYKVMQNETPKQGLISCLYNPKACVYPGYSELGTLLPNLMCGILSFENLRDLREQHRIYMFDIPPTQGRTSDSHYNGTKPEFTYWYKLNGQDHVELPNLEYLITADKIRSVSEPEFVSHYRIFGKFRPDNVELHNICRELGKGGLPCKRSRNGVGGKKHSKKRNKTRRKYRKIKSRRRRVVR